MNSSGEPTRGPGLVLVLEVQDLNELPLCIDIFELCVDSV